jgi:osmotically-inducible protein OsmY
MRLHIPIAISALACALPAIAQYSSSSSTSTTTGGSTIQQSTTSTPGTATSITGSTGGGTVSSAGAVVDPQQDQVLLQQVVAQLTADPAIAGATIDVQVVGGRVTLNGVARDTNQAENAKEIAQGIAGAANVASNLTTARQ